MRRAIGFVATVVLLLTAQFGLQVARDRAYGESTLRASVLYVSSGTALERMALGFDAALADVYWIRAIQHYGGTRRSPDPVKHFDLLYPLLDVTTTLDPRFAVAYRFGAVFLAEQYPGGPGRPDQAVALLQKGVREQPDKWQYLQDIGFVYYWWLRDYKAASSWFLRASKVPGAPWFLRSLAAVTLTEGGDRASSRLLWQQLRETADNDWLRANAELRLAQLNALDEIDRLEMRVRQFRQRFGTLPGSWAALGQSGLLATIPIDPSGEPYVLDPATGRVAVSEASRLYPLPRDHEAPPSTR